MHSILLPENISSCTVLITEVIMCSYTHNLALIASFMFSPLKSCTSYSIKGCLIYVLFPFRFQFQ